MSRNSHRQPEPLLTPTIRGPGRPVSLNQTPPPPGQVTFHSGSNRITTDGSPRPVVQSRLSQITQIRTIPPVPSTQQDLGLERTPVHAKNEYVDTPSSDSTRQHLLELPKEDTSKSNNNNHLPTITTQPLKSVEKVDSCQQSSILCSNCRKCRCNACTKRRDLPRKWICKGKQELSLQCCVDACTCLCLVKCCFQNCFNYLDRDEDATKASDNPCGCCEQPRCLKRWACMGGMAVACPTLLLYPFCKLGLMACTECYNCCSRRGCTCHQHQTQNNTGTKVLLPESDSSTT